MALLAELRQRKLVQWALAYAAAAFALLQGVDMVAQRFGWPESIGRFLIIAAFVGFFVTLLLAWYHGEHGAQRVSGTELLLLALLLAIGGGLIWKFAPGPPAPVAASAPAAIAPAVVKAPAPAKSIAVLPFESLSEDKANAYFADGIQDQILTGLAKIGDLKVISRTSTQRYAARPDNLSQIALELGVAHILEGSVQRAGNRVRINVQLIEAASDSHLWADTYDRTLDDVFAVESEVAEKIAGALAATLTRSEQTALAQKPTENADAYSAYLKARVLNSRTITTRGGADEILAAYREAVRLDPKFALAWAELSRVALRTVWGGFDPSGALQEEGKQALNRATALAPDLPQVDMARAVYLYYVKRDFAGAAAIVGTVKGRLPGDADVWLLSGLLARRLGQWDQSTADLEHARSLAPNDGDLAYHLAINHAVKPDCPSALPLVAQSLRLQPGNPNPMTLQLQCLWMLGDLPEAARVLAAIDGEAPVVQALRGMQALYQRDYAKASQLLRGAIAADRAATQTDSAFDAYIPASMDWQLQLALSEQRAGHAAEARAAYEQVKATATAALDAKPDNRYVETSWHLVLGLALAGLGEPVRAAAQGNLAVAMVPESEDRLEAPFWQYYLARIHALNGDAAQAVPLARRLLGTTASFLTPGLLRIDPAWDAIRNDPGIVALTRPAAP